MRANVQVCAGVHVCVCAHAYEDPGSIYFVWCVLFFEAGSLSLALSQTAK